MLQMILNLLLAIRPDDDLHITREELVKGEGYLLHYETRKEGEEEWTEWVGFARFTNQCGGITLEWEHKIK